MANPFKDFLKSFLNDDGYLSQEEKAEVIAVEAVEKGNKKGNKKDNKKTFKVKAVNRPDEVKQRGGRAPEGR